MRSVISGGAPSLIALASLTLVACSSAPPTPDTPQPTATAVTTPPPAPSDLSPVPDPQDLVGIVRWRSPKAAIDSLATCLNAPEPMVALVRDGLPQEIAKDFFRREADPSRLGAVLALDAPVDAVAVLDAGNRRKPAFGAVAFGVTSLDGAKAAFEKEGPLTEENGMWMVKNRSREVCALVRSSGPTPARVVCSDDAKSVIALAPWLARTAPSLAPAPSGLHAELRLAPIEAKLGSLARDQLGQLGALATETKTGNAKVDRALQDAAAGLAGEAGKLMSDLGKGVLSVDLDPQKCLTVGAALELRGTSSFVAQTIAERPGRAIEPPPMFWKLPKDSDSAFWGVGGDPSRMQPIVRVLKDAITGGLELAKVGGADDHKALTDLLDVTLGIDVVSVSASGGAGIGMGFMAALKADRGDAKREPLQKEVDALLKSVGWTLVGMKAPSATIEKALTDLVAVYNRPGLQKPLAELLKKEDKELKPPTLKKVAAPAKLGKGAVAYEVKFTTPPVDRSPKQWTPVVVEADGKPTKPVKPPPPAKKEKATITMHIMVVPDGDTTWVTFGFDKDLLVKQLLLVKGGAAADTLASRADLAQLKAKKTVSGGFLTLAPVVRALDGLAQSNDPDMREAKEVQRMVSTLPNKGLAPIFFTSSYDQGAQRAWMSFEIGKPFFADLGKLAVDVFAMSQRGGPSTPPSPPPPPPAKTPAKATPAKATP